MSDNQNNSHELTEEVKAMKDISITGNVTPMEWFQHLTFENGKPYTIAIILLSDIVYWYRPTEARCEHTGKLLGYRKKFKSDFMQRQTKAFSKMFGFSEKQVRDALKFLEEKGIIQRHFRDVTVPSGDLDEATLSNRQYIQLFPEELKKIQKIHTYEHRSQDPPPSMSQDPDEEVTYTKTTSETTSSDDRSDFDQPAKDSKKEKWTDRNLDINEIHKDSERKIFFKHKQNSGNIIAMNIKEVFDKYLKLNYLESTIKEAIIKMYEQNPTLNGSVDSYFSKVIMSVSKEKQKHKERSDGKYNSKPRSVQGSFNNAVESGGISDSIKENLDENGQNRILKQLFMS